MGLGALFRNSMTFRIARSVDPFAALGEERFPAS